MQPGDRVTVDQVIAEVETAKAVVEVPVPYAGIVAVLHAAPGSVISVGQPLITVTEDRAAPAEMPGGVAGTAPAGTISGAAGFREPGVVVPEQVPPADGGDVDGGDGGGGEEASGSVLIGYGTTVAQARTRRGRRRGGAGAPPPGGPTPSAARTEASASPAAAMAPATVAQQPTAASTAAASTSSASSSGHATPERSRRVAVISPLVRKQAKDAGLDLTSLTGTGPDGLVSRQDVRTAIAERTTRQPPTAHDADASAVTTAVAATGTGTASTGAGAAGYRGVEAVTDAAVEGTTGTGRSSTGVAWTGERRIPLRGARRAMADKLSRSRREIPEATVWVDVDATGLVETRRAMNAADPARSVSLLALLARFTIVGLRRYPELNARVEPDEIIVPDGVNLGFAAQTEHGLVVPVVRDAHRLTTRELSARLADRTAAARERRLSPADLSGGTFTVNNYGVFGVDGSAAIINHPEVAILGLGRVIDRPWVVDGQLAVRKIAELTLSFDHRACDGGTAGGFLRYVADCIESPANAFGDM